MMPKPTTYDEITRRTVPSPDSSFRPTVDQVRQAGEGFRALDADEQRLSERVRRALVASGGDLERVAFDVDRNQVTLRGEVPDSATLVRITDLIRALDGVDELIDQLVIAAK